MKYLQWRAMVRVVCDAISLISNRIQTGLYTTAFLSLYNPASAINSVLIARLLHEGPIDTSCAYVRLAGVSICARLDQAVTWRRGSCRNMTTMSLEPSSAPAGDVGAGCWEAREEAAARLEAMAAAARVDEELPEEQLQGNSRIQEDEVADVDQFLFSYFSLGDLV